LASLEAETDLDGLASAVLDWYLLTFGLTFGFWAKAEENANSIDVAIINFFIFILFLNYIAIYLKIEVTIVGKLFIW
jgi:hypothetical protein